MTQIQTQNMLIEAIDTFGGQSMKCSDIARQFFLVEQTDGSIKLFVNGLLLYDGRDFEEAMSKLRGSVYGF